MRRCGESAGGAKPCTILLMRLLMSLSCSPSCFCLRRRTQISRTTALTSASVVHTAMATMASVGRVRPGGAGVVAADVGRKLSVYDTAARVAGVPVVSTLDRPDEPVGVGAGFGVKLAESAMRPGL
jgi:hypothetical protein